MCREAWCLEGVLDVVTDTLGALESGNRIESVLCSVLAERFGAAAAAVVLVDPAARTATVTAWPPALEMLRMKRVLAGLPPTFPIRMRQLLTQRRPSCLSGDASPTSWQRTVVRPLLQEVTGCRDVAHLPLSGPTRRLRFALIARAADFDQREMHLMEYLQVPLSALYDVAARATGEQSPAVGSDPVLTDRELDVLSLVAEGLLARTIATRLAVSPRTVHKHLGNVYRKLDTHDRLAAVLRAEMLGILSTPTYRPEPGTHKDAFMVRW